MKIEVYLNFGTKLGVADCKKSTFCHFWWLCHFLFFEIEAFLNSGTKLGGYICF